MYLYNKRHFLACRDCGVAQPEVHIWAAGPDEATEEVVAEYRRFVAVHTDHSTVRLRRRGTESHADRPLWDPMATITFEVTDGSTPFLVQSTRLSIEEPRSYQIAPGGLEVRNSEVAIDEGNLRRGLDRDLYPHVLRPTQLDGFIALLHEVIRDIPPDALEIAFDDAEDPAVSIACLPSTVHERLVERSADLFDPWELSRVRRFLQDNREADGLLALRVRRELQTLTASVR